MNEQELDPRLEATLRAGLREWASAPETPEYVRLRVAAIGNAYVEEAARRRSLPAWRRALQGGGSRPLASPLAGLVVVGLVAVVVAGTLLWRGSANLGGPATGTGAPRTPGMTQIVPGGSPAPSDGWLVGGFMGPDEPFVIRENGAEYTLRVSADGGATWAAPRRLPGSAESVQFADPRHGWAVDATRSGTTWTPRVWRTDDGGETWHSASLESRVADAGSDPWTSIQFFDAERGRAEVAMTAPAKGAAANSDFLDCRIYGTSDGGVSWSAGTDVPCSAPTVQWADPGTGLLLDNSAAPATEATVDGGATWTRATLPGVPPDHSFVPRLFEAVAPRHLRLAGTYMTKSAGPAAQPFVVYESANGGASWTLAYRSPAEFDRSIGSVSSVGPDHWYGLQQIDGAPQLSRLVETRDAGRSWSIVPIESVRSGGVTYFPGGISGLTAGTMLWADERHGMLNAVYMDCRGARGTCGGEAAVFLTSDGGRTWTQVPA